jgi:YVTN family beta-propeller protein
MSRKFCACLTTTLLAVLVTRWAAPASESTALRLVATIPMEGVEGRIDHMTASRDGRRLFVAALGSDRVLRIDIGAAKVTATISGVREPQGVCYLEASRRLVVASGGDGNARFYDQAMAPIGTVGSLEDADNVRYDAGANLVYVGYGQGGLAVIDPDKMVKLAEIRLDGHPESFQLESSGTRIFVNVPTAGEIEVVDRQKRSVVAKWRVRDGADNFPMALDEPDRRLFVGLRKPARMLVLDTESGRTIARVDACGDTDDLFYDQSNRSIYLSGGEGCVSVFKQVNADTYRPLATIRTSGGARTSFFVPAARRLYVAAPHRGALQAAVLVFETEKANAGK